MSTNKKLQHYAQRPGLLDVDRSNLSIIVDGFADCELEGKEERHTHQIALLYLLRDNIREFGKQGGAIVYALTPRDVEDVADFLEQFFVDVFMSHNDMSKNKREIAERLFLSNRYGILVTTSDIGQNIDKPNVRLVAHFGLPLSVSDYWQQIGQAGKNGKKAYAVVIHDKMLMKRNKKLIKSAPEDAQKQMKKRQKELESIITGEKCIMQGLQKSLGEERKRCNHYSVCRRKKAK